MNRDEIKTILQNEPIFFSRVGFGYDPPLMKDGEPVIFSHNYTGYRRVHDDFESSGVRIHSSILHSGWVGIDEYNYTATDKTVEAVLKDAPDRLYFPRIKLNPPTAWCRENPEEVFVFWDGPETAMEISALVDTPDHDWHGVENPNGYPLNGGDGSFVDTRPNMGHKICLQSFSSQKWLQDAGVTLKKIIERLENGPYSKQIIGYQIAFGRLGENNLWGTTRPGKTPYRGDYGISHRKAFIKWAIQKHGGESQLRCDWKLKKDFDLSDIKPIPPMERYMVTDSLSDNYYENCPLMCDYNEFLAKTTVDAIEYFGKIVHDTCDKVAGTFYGYLVHPQASHSGHLAVERILNSKHIDFLCSPKAYSYHTVGEPGSEQGPTRSYNRKKIWIDEVDNRTHLDRRNTSDMTHNMAETLTVLWREFSKNITGNQNFWWMDLGEGWFDHPEIMHNIKLMSDMQIRVNKKQHKTNSEVLLVVDESSIMYSKVSYGLNHGLMKRFEREAKLAGVSTDLFRLKDLLSLPLEQYKTIVFLNTTHIPFDLWDRIKTRINKGTSIIWNYASGIQAPIYSIDNVRKITGFSIRESTGYSDYIYSDIDKDFTPIRINGLEGVTPLISFDGETIFAKRDNEFGGISYFACEPMLRIKQLREIFKNSGVHIYTEVPCTIYADNRMVGVFTHDCNVNKITLLEKMTVKDVITGKVYENVTVIDTDILPQRMQIFEIL